MDPISLDQLKVFTVVVDQGSFSAAARVLNRPQSAVSYAVRKLEESYGLELFDRNAYRPTLTHDGKSLLPQARRVLKDAERLRATAKTLRKGVEAEVGVVVDGLFSIDALMPVVREFRSEWPGVRLKMFAEHLGATVSMITRQTVDLGIISEPFGDTPGLECHPVANILLVPVVAADHPLAGVAGPIAPHVMDEHNQLVLTDRSKATDGMDFGVLSHDTWRVGELSAKRTMLLHGLGWGTLPAYMVEDDLTQGRLVRINPIGIGQAKSLRMLLARRTDHGFGPAATWLYDALVAGGSDSSDEEAMVVPPAS